VIVMTRAADTPPLATPLHALTTQQRRVIDAVEQYARATHEPCPARYVARRLRLHHSTVQDHFTALHRKGLLQSSTGPAVLAITLD
jgi:DNA-binding IscR family transcriptional regulator